LKQWVQKLIDQLDYGFESNDARTKPKASRITEDRATLLYVIDLYSKHLIEVDDYPVRKVRESFDAFAKDLLVTDKEITEDALFRFRQFFSAYKTAEYAFLRKTFEDFKGIVWNFVEQMSEEAGAEAASDKELNIKLRELKDAVEADSIPILRAKSREFIEKYSSHQTKKEERRTKRVRGIKKNLDLVRKQLTDADRAMRTDHLTGAWNRRSFDERVRQHIELFKLQQTPISLLLMDIDFFKKINDTYGHDIGDFILKECVKLLQSQFPSEGDFVARIGGEEFAILLPNHAIEHALKRTDELMARIRKEVFVEQDRELRFTVSVGIAQLVENESSTQWYKRADQALYESKQSGRNRSTVAPPHLGLSQVA
jgi:diguanylate cyclase